MVFLGFTRLTYKIPNDRIRLFLNPLSGDLMKKFLFISSTLVFLLTGLNQGFADKLDDVINSGKLRCGVVLDFPPIGYRDSNNEPAGFDVEYCKDLAKVLEVELEILPLTWAERLPVIVTNRADVVFGATSDTLERAKTVGFTIPYAIYYAQAVVGKNSGIKTFEDMKGKRIAAAVGTVPEIEFLKYAEKWGTKIFIKDIKVKMRCFLQLHKERLMPGSQRILLLNPLLRSTIPSLQVQECLGQRTTHRWSP